MEAQIAGKDLTIEGYISQIDTQSQVIGNQGKEITSLEAANDKLKGELSTTQSENRNLNTQLRENRNRVISISNIPVTQYYQWEYRNSEWNWNLNILLSVYVNFWEKQRPLLTQYVNMTKDPDDEEYIESVVQRLSNAVSKRGYSEVQKLNCVVSFVQNLPYTVDEVTTSADEYPRYPIVETLFDRGGDCEDTSILVATLLDNMGYAVALIELINEQHMAVGIVLPSVYGTYYEYKEKKYSYLETTADGWGVGDFPTDLKDASARIYPLRSS